MSDALPDVHVELARSLLRGDAVLVWLPLSLSRSVTLLPGPVGEEGGAALVAVGEIVTRCAPWLMCYLVPALKIDDAHYNGVHLPGRRQIAVSIGRGLRAAVATTHHEIWHACESELSTECVDAVDVLTRDGRAWATEYLDRPVERRARLYQHWACCRDEGWGPVGVGGRPLGEVDRIFLDVYCGAFGRAVMAADLAAAAPPPTPLRQRAVAKLAAVITGRRAA